MDDLSYLRNTILTQHLAITAEGLSSVVMDLFNPKRETPSQKYSEIAKSYLADNIGTVDDESINVTDDYSSSELPQGSIAYYPIFGFITSSSCWRFATKQFEKDVIAAEDNAAITCHFFHINSPGGEAWYMDRISETLSNLTKPIVVLVEGFCCSAAYYIACHANKIFSLSAADRIGCIGTMVSVFNDQGWMEKMGIKVFDVKATKSDLKNHEIDKLMNGDTDIYIQRFLDPLNEPFLAAVRTNRPLLKDAPDDETALRGETYLTDEALIKGLIDGKATLAEALATAKALGDEFSNKSIKDRALKYFT